MENNVPSRLYLACHFWFFLKQLTCHSNGKPYNRNTSSCDKSIMKRTVLVEQCTFSAVSRLPFEEFFCTSTLNTYAIRPTKGKVCLGSVNNDGHFTCRKMYLLSCISVEIGRIFLIYRTFHSRQKAYDV
jgi:hypothetical protein